MGNRARGQLAKKLGGSSNDVKSVIIKARGLSSAMSAANAAKDCLRDWHCGTPDGEHVAMSVFSDGSYGVAKGLFYSFPCTAKDGKWTIVQGLEISDAIRAKMKVTEDELLAEKKEAGLG